jgi:hypothetical protein
MTGIGMDTDPANPQHALNWFTVQKNKQGIRGKIYTYHFRSNYERHFPLELTVPEFRFKP